MGKDPAVLFYTSDFISGTLSMTNEQRGKYIMLLCLQHQKGRLSRKDMVNICKTYDKDVFDKFIKDKDGNYYNLRMDTEIEKRKKYSESRRNNRIGKVTYVEHMENENEDINESTDKEVVQTIEQHLLSEWGREGRVGYSVITKFVDLMKEHGKDKVFDAISESARHNKKSLAYVQGILKPKQSKPGELNLKRVGEK